MGMTAGFPLGPRGSQNSSGASTSRPHDADVDIGYLIPYIAGQVGQAGLARLAGTAHPELDQHVAAVADAATAELGARRSDPARLLAFLLNYASGFVAAATRGGWLPVLSEEQPDWETMRLAAVSQLVSQVLQPARSQNLPARPSVGADFVSGFRSLCHTHGGRCRLRRRGRLELAS